MTVLPALAVPVTVTVTGEVEFNSITLGQLGMVNIGDPVVMTFAVDSDTFTDSASFPTRGYDIDLASFTLQFGSQDMTLQSPFPLGQTPYFTIRDNDPAVDGFWVSTNFDFPLGVPISQTGQLGQFINNYSVTYTGDTLPSLDILDAAGTYDFTGLTVFNWTVDDGPFMPLGVLFEQMIIDPPQPAIPAASTWGLVIMFLISLTIATSALKNQEDAARPAA